MPYSTLLFEVRDQVAYVTLNRPEAANTLNEALVRELQDAMLRCENEANIRAVVLTGAGSMFCGGGDLKAFLAQGQGIGNYVGEVIHYFHDALAAMARMNALVIASVNGVAAGGGMSIVCACDLAIAASSARFTMAYTRAGLVPDGGSTFNLPRLIGLRRALDFTLTNRILSAQEAMEWGLITRVVPDAELQAQTEELANTLVAGASGALSGAKRLMRSSWTETLAAQMDAEREAMVNAVAGPEGQEGITAFIEKRPPKYS